MVRALDLPARALVPGRGLRTQVIRATGAGKSLVAVRSAEELHAGRVLVLVPSLDLLVQTEARGARVAVGARGSGCLPRGAEENFRRTLVFHHVVKEAEAFAVGLPAPCRAAARQGAGVLPADRVADLLCGKHKPLHRRRVLSELGPCLLGRWLQRQCQAGRHPVPARRRAAGAAGPRLRVSDGSSQAVPGRPWVLSRRC
ncbi:DEAD/DEAH box helicase family protein [Streptomyces sp. MOE7]|uniref:DEAD/DEAH box helicase family protein n=1 Tax=Streptomyces sp. MOE7 TaxID=1961713 RepID=UPI003FA6F6C9